VRKLLPRHRAFADKYKNLANQPAPDRSVHVDEIAETVHAREISTIMNTADSKTERAWKKNVIYDFAYVNSMGRHSATFLSLLDDRRDEYSGIKCDVF